MALSFCCGAECEVNGTGVGVPTGTVKHWVTFDAAVTNVSTTVRTGSRAWQHNPSGAQARLGHTVSNTPTQLVGRAYVRWSVLPSASSGILWASTAGGTNMGVGYNQSTGKITSFSASTYASTGTTAATGQWYCVEFYANVASNPHTIDVRIDGSAITQQTAAVAASTFNVFYVGNHINATTTMFSDDIAYQQGTSSYIGIGAVYGLTPNADGTHSFEDGDFIWDASGANVPTNSTTTYTYVNTALDTTIGNFLNHAVSEASSPDYVEWTLPNLPVSPPSVRGVEVVAAYHSFGTGANNISLKMNDGTNTADVHGLIDISETTILIPSFHMTTAPDGGAWSETDVNALKLRWGYSTDANPDAYLDGVRVEVEVEESTGGASANPDAVACTVALDLATVAVEATPGAASLTATADQSPSGVGANPDAASSTTFLDQCAIAVEAVPAAFVLQGQPDGPPVDVEVAVEAAAQSVATLDQASAAETVERIPDAIEILAYADQPPVEVEATPAAVAPAAFLDQCAVSIEAAPLGIARPDGKVDVPLVGVEAALADAAQAIASLDGPTVAAEATLDAATLTAFLDQATVSVEAAPDAGALSAFLDQVTVDAGGDPNADRTPDAIEILAYVDQTTIGVGANPLSIARPDAKVDEPLISVEATPDTFAITTGVDTPIISGAVAYVHIALESGSLLLLESGSLLRSEGGAVLHADPPIDAVAIPASFNQSAVGTEATPDTFAASMVAPGVAVATWLQPDAVSRPSTHMDRATPDIGVVPDPTAVTVYLDQPAVEVGVGAGLDLENDSAVLLESGSLVLIEAGVTGANAQPGSIAIPAYVDQCEVSWPGVTISDTFHAPPTAFYGQAGLADVTLDIWHASFNAQAPSTGSGAVPAPAQYDVAVPTPSVSTSGTDGNANPGDFTVSAFFDQCVVGVGANPGSIARPSAHLDQATAGGTIEVIPDPIVVEVGSLHFNLEDGSHLLTEDGGRLEPEEAIRPTVDTGEVGAVSTYPAAIDIATFVETGLAGVDVPVDVVMVLVDAATPSPAAGGRRLGRTTRRAILVLRRSGKSRLVVRSGG